MVNQCRIGRDAHGNTETNARNGHFETAYIHACQQTIEIRKVESEDGDTDYQIQTSTKETSEQSNNGIDRMFELII